LQLKSDILQLQCGHFATKIGHFATKIGHFATIIGHFATVAKQKIKNKMCNKKIKHSKTRPKIIKQSIVE